MRRSVLLAAILLTLTSTTPAVAAPPPRPAAASLAAATPVQIYGAWHCGNDYCTWRTVRTVAEFDSQNHWLVDRGDGRPSVNLVVLSFVNPLALLHQTTDATTLDGVPRGITSEIVSYFTSHGIRVMLSIGGITYTDDWDAALAENPALLGQRAAAVATRLGVGIEIDYEQNSDPNLAGLQSFIDAYRAVHPYDATGARPQARLTIDVAAGDRWLIDLNRRATADWLRTDAPVLDYANAMVAARPASASNSQASWQEHVDGKPQYNPPVPPLAPAKFTGGVYIAYGGKPLPECVDYINSVQRAAAPYVQTVTPNGAGTSAGMLGYMFWAAERPSTRGIGTVPPNTCEGGVGAGATALTVPVPMPALRQT
ncbi:hypothetical protein EV384_4883 [Micromonospora kangleipakensis]|uniref:Glycosyl hydrolase family 18 (Putative chitinase) n=1 Tax=Micromonospora kangleipakensis TaxID=1077942 RepID=A0A4Q8BEV9_9ACTN|nr:hypothetical protein [Micromonospora kangleipakensis]RZU76248.1 hypothetical protein EV384_4883 [Micromonospora kangleipakensis]